MSPSASEHYEEGLALPRSMRMDVALRLLDSVEVLDQRAVDQAWIAEIGSRVDDLLVGKVEAISHEAVLTRLAEQRAARQA